MKQSLKQLFESFEHLRNRLFVNQKFVDLRHKTLTYLCLKYLIHEPFARFGRIAQHARYCCVLEQAILRNKGSLFNVLKTY